MLRRRARRAVWRLALKVASGVHTALYRVSGGRVGGAIGNVPVLLLTTTGRKSGRQRTTPLLFFRDGDDVVVVASNGGMDWFPAWWLNLQHEQAAMVEIGRKRHHVTASKADPARRARLWPELTAHYPGYLRYEARTAREIPLVILHPTLMSGLSAPASRAAASAWLQHVGEPPGLDARLVFAPQESARDAE